MPEITIKAMLKWLDGQRDAVNARIIASPPENQGRYMPELQVINAIAERLQEMTAVEYLEAMRKLCDDYRFVLKCDGKCFDRCGRDERKNPREAVEIVKRWKEERDAAD